MKFTKRQLLDWLLDVTGAEEVYPFTREKKQVHARHST